MPARAKARITPSVSFSASRCSQTSATNAPPCEKLKSLLACELERAKAEATQRRQHWGANALAVPADAVVRPGGAEVAEDGVDSFPPPCSAVTQSASGCAQMPRLIRQQGATPPGPTSRGKATAGRRVGCAAMRFCCARNTRRATHRRRKRCRRRALLLATSTSGRRAWSRPPPAAPRHSVPRSRPLPPLGSPLRAPPLSAQAPSRPRESRTRPDA